MHGVYPFNGTDEVRRTLSYNCDLLTEHQRVSNNIASETVGDILPDHGLSETTQPNFKPNRKARRALKKNTQSKWK